MNLCYSDLKFNEKCVLPDTVDYLKNLILCTRRTSINWL